MKKALLLCLFIIPIVTKAQNDSEFKKETIEYFKLIAPVVIYEDLINEIGEMTPQENKESYIKEAKETIEWFIQ